jgi:SRSO17 transposase
MNSILEHNDATALLEQAALTPQQVADCQQHLQTFLQRYLPLFQRAEQRHNATIVVQGKLSGLQRKTSEPIAYQAGLQRKPIQAFVGWAPWDDETVMAELRRHVSDAWADPDAVFVLDGSAFPKKGDASCGVARPWCGRLGKVDNCQVGVFLTYSCRQGHTGLDRQLFLPKDWADNRLRRADCHVPDDLVYQEHWQIALALIQRCKDVPHAWIATDSEFGRVVAFRDALHHRGERYVVEVRAETLVRDLQGRRPRRRRRWGRRREVPWRRVDAWATQQAAARWRRLTIRAGEKGPVTVEVLSTCVQAWADGQTKRPAERLTVIRTVQEKPQTWYTLSNAAEEVSPAQLARAHAGRHRCEEVFEEGKGEVGLGQYEVRRWDGWHHHMTLSLLALWFVSLERSRMRGEKGRGEQLPGSAGLHTSAASAAAERGADRCGDQLCLAA